VREVPHRKRAAFLVVEGGDGSGKDVQALRLREFLEVNGYNHSVWLTKEPRDTEEGEVIRRILRGKLAKPSPLELQTFWYREDRRRHQKEIKDHLDKDQVVICVRYLYSSIAYGMADGVSFKEIWKVNQNFLRPERVFLLDVPPEAALKRIDKGRSERELFEQLEFQSRVRDAYEKVASQFPEVVRIDGNRDPDSITEDIQKIVREDLKIPVHEEFHHLTPRC
jgi:dTMP kinase